MTDSLSKIVAALRSYQQADEDGVMVLVSRQACEEGAAALAALQAGEQQPVAWEGLDENNKPFVYRGEGEPGDKPLVYASPVAQGWQPIREALEIGLDAANEVATRVHSELKGYLPRKHEAADADVAKIKAALALLPEPTK